MKDPVIETIEKWWEAWFGRDLVTLEKLTGEAFVCLSDKRELRIQGKPALMEKVPRFTGLCPKLSWAVREPSIERLRGASICTYKLGFVTSLGKYGPTVKDTMTDVLIQEGGNWLIVAHHGDLAFTVMPPFNPLVPLTKGNWPGIREVDLRKTSFA